MKVLVVTKRIRATPEALFAAFTDPEKLRVWWGPAGVSCSEASIEPRVGGSFRIANTFPDESIIWISGVYSEFDPPERLAYTWVVDDGPEEHVAVEFHRDGEFTEVVVTHTEIPNRELLESHRVGWDGCLVGLERFFGD